MRRGRGLWIALAIVVGVLAVAAALLWIAFRVYIVKPMTSPAAARMVRSDKRVRAAQSAIDAELRRIKAAGQAVTAKDIVPSPVPDAENAAPLYQKAFGALELPTKDAVVVENLLRPPAGTKRDRWIAPARGVLARNETALAFTYQAAERPKCRFSVPWADPADALLKHLSPLRHLSWLLSAQAVTRSLDGDMRGALQAVQCGIALGNALADEPSDTSQIVRYTLYARALEGMQAGIVSETMAADLGRPLYDQLAGIEIAQPFRQALLADRATAISLYQIAQSKPERLGIELNAVQKTILPPGWTLDAAEWLPLMGERIALVDKPYRVVKVQLESLDARGRKLAKDAGDGDPVVGMVFVDAQHWASRPWQARDICRARIGLVQAVLALKAYQAQHGAYPDSLTTLRSAVRWKIPQDPFSGRDFVYKREGKTAVLYSIGPNLRDDGGVPLQLRSVQSGEYLGDMVWRLGS